MTEDEARQVELLRAVETEDRDATLITREDRAQTDVYARAANASFKDQGAADAFLAARANFASARLSTRHPGIGGLLQRSRWPRWLGIGFPLLALAGGFVANEFGTGRRLDLLAVPLIGTIAWNLLVYVLVIIASFSRKKAHGLGPLYQAIAGMMSGGHRDLDRGTALHRAAISFQTRWAKASAPLTGARIARTLHLGAALFAIGLIGGIYLRALVIEYRAGWESTFLGPGAVHALLSTILGPASWATGMRIPAVEGIAAIRWTGSETGGVNAGPWIVLYTATVAGLVIVPRLFLAFWQSAKAFRLSKRFPAAGREDFYIRRLLRSASGAPGTARITPYAYHLGEETRQQLSAALRGALGDGTDVRFDEPIDYGDEDRWLAENVNDPGIDYQILLFTLAATPEEENHGALAAALAKRFAKDPGTILAALIDESPFRTHFAGQAGLEKRITGRLAAWRKTLAPAGIAPIGVDLSLQGDGSLAQRIESGLLPDGAMHG